MSLHDGKLKFLEEQANRIRQIVIETLAGAGSGHTAGSLGMADIFSALYFHVLSHDPKRPDWPLRDRLVLSNGHICPVQYVALACAGYFPADELKTLRRINSRLQGHPHRTALPGIETTSGPLGSGLAQACGMALAASLDGLKSHIYCLTSDGEHQEGNHWEAVMFASRHKIGNLTVVVDRNNIQIDGTTEKVMPLESLRAKYEAWNWHVREIDGHNVQEFVDAANEAKAVWERPAVIIAHTIPGRGVSFMENDYLWHGKTPTKEEAARALRELNAWREEIENEHD